MRENHATFDDLKNKGMLYGELLWNLVEFMTGEDTNILRRAFCNRIKACLPETESLNQLRSFLKKDMEN